MSEYLVLDVETQKISSEVDGGWNNISAFGLTIAVTLNDSGDSRWYDEDAVSELIDDLLSAPLIITFNGLRFDYEVLRPYGLQPEMLYPKSFDILAEMTPILGHRVSLESVAQATLGEGKSSSGIEAVEWFKEGKIDQVIDYCQQDVELTQKIYQFIDDNGCCYYLDIISGGKRKCQISGWFRQAQPKS